jgi:hypothetical protein
VLARQAAGRAPYAHLPATPTYRASDGTLTSNLATVTITVTAVNDAPTVTVAAGGRCGTNDRSGTINLTVGDVDSEEAALTPRRRLLKHQAGAKRQRIRQARKLAERLRAAPVRGYDLELGRTDVSAQLSLMLLHRLSAWNEEQL